jgi:archaellum component FlaC
MIKDNWAYQTLKNDLDRLRKRYENVFSPYESYSKIFSDLHVFAIGIIEGLSKGSKNFDQEVREVIDGLNAVLEEVKKG